MKSSSASLSLRQGNSPLPLTTGWSKDKPIGRRSSCRSFARWRADPSTSKPRSDSSPIAPDVQGQWGWGQWSQAIPLPETVLRALDQGAHTQAPTLRAISGDDGRFVAVLDLVLEVPAKYVSPLEQETRVLGWDWGIRSLITVSILEKSEGEEPYRQISRPVFLDSGGLDGRQARLRREIDRLKACQERYD